MALNTFPMFIDRGKRNKNCNSYFSVNASLNSNNGSNNNYNNNNLNNNNNNNFKSNSNCDTRAIDKVAPGPQITLWLRAWGTTQNGVKIAAASVKISLYLCVSMCVCVWQP